MTRSFPRLGVLAERRPALSEGLLLRAGAADVPARASPCEARARRRAGFAAIVLAVLLDDPLALAVAARIGAPHREASFRRRSAARERRPEQRARRQQQGPKCDELA